MRDMLQTAVLSITLISGALATAAAAPFAIGSELMATGMGQAISQASAAPGPLLGGEAVSPAPQTALSGTAPQTKPPQDAAAGSGQPQADGSPVLTFPVISDIHVQSWEDGSHEKLVRVLSDLNEINPSADTLVINGDLTEGMPEDYAKLKELMQSAPHPESVLYNIGNHEFYKAWYSSRTRWNPDGFPNGETEQASISRFLTFSGENKVYYEKTIKGYHFIFLGSERYRQSDQAHAEDAYLSPEQLEWLKQTLKKDAHTNKPVFVFLHQPLPATVSGTHFCCTNNRAVIQHEELKAILSQYPQVIYFSSHSHWELNQPDTLVRDGFTMVNTASVSETWTSDGKGAEKLKGKEESEGLYVEVHPDRVRIKGRDFYRKQWIPEAQFNVPVAQKK
ncbi:metallophosphoesterase family protein [Paenibacillus tyrfis]|uniref:metallophosphoesterase family protein n=1 Tax=Paenibacillus tyrfis TaxID=1501230 RepID=UPI00209D4906|nr:metallophosphoesterase [Paenibacillus tyrfis]MCP1307710.1 metallophosphoesterase [Paenibacillus tyrfis]